MSELEPARTYSNLNATEVLRRLLDERGVEWHDTKIGKGFITVYEHDGITWIVTEHSSGRLSVKGCVKPTQGHYDGMTPAQAIAATLGTGTCHMEQTGHVKVAGVDYYDDDYECSECGVELFEGYNYCPNCGRRIEQ